MQNKKKRDTDVQKCFTFKWSLLLSHSWQFRWKYNSSLLVIINCSYNISVDIFFLYQLVYVILPLKKKYYFGYARSQLWHMGSLVSACRILYHDRGLNIGPLHWEYGILAIGSQGNPCYTFFIYQFVRFFFNQFLKISVVFLLYCFTFILLYYLHIQM